MSEPPHPPIIAKGTQAIRQVGNARKRLRALALRLKTPRGYKQSSTAKHSLKGQ